MNGYLGLGVALLVAWLALRLALGSTVDAVHVVGIAGAVLVALGVRRRAMQLARGAAVQPAGEPSAHDGPPAAGARPNVIRLRSQRRRHG